MLVDRDASARPRSIDRSCGRGSPIYLLFQPYKITISRDDPGINDLAPPPPPKRAL